MSGSAQHRSLECSIAAMWRIYGVLYLEAVWKQSLYKRRPYVICGARLRTDILDNRSLAMLLEISKGLIYQTLVSGQPLRDQNTQQVVFTAVQHPFGSAASAALPWLTCTRQLVRIPFCVGTLKRWEQLRKLFQREAGRC